MHKNSQNSRMTRRVSKSDWLRAALDFLRREGIEGVRVERLAAHLSVAKSGFYYHFRDRDHLRAELLDKWKSVDGLPFDLPLQPDETNVAEVLNRVAETVEKYRLGELDFAIRQWATGDPHVRKVYRKEMKLRVEHIRGAFALLGFEGDDLEARARMFVAYTTSEATLFPDLKASEKKRMRALRIELLTWRG